MGNRGDKRYVRGRNRAFKRAAFDGGVVGGEQAIDTEQWADSRLGDHNWFELPPGIEKGSLMAPSGALAAINCGNPGDPPIVLVPGATGSKEDFVLMMPLLAAAGYRVLSFDLAGQYESAGAGPERLTPPRTRYDYELFVDDLLTVLRQVAQPAHVVGYSFAGAVAGLAYAREPERFASLTLLSCPPLAGQSFRGISRIGALSNLASGRVAAALMIWGINRNLVPVPPGRLDFVRSRFALTRRQSVRDIMTLMKHAPDLVAVLGGAALPTFVAVGEHDLWPTPLHADFARAIGAELAVYRAGHSPCETSPHQLSRDLLRVIARAQPPKPSA